MQGLNRGKFYEFPGLIFLWKIKYKKGSGFRSLFYKYYRKHYDSFGAVPGIGICGVISNGPRMYSFGPR